MTVPSARNPIVCFGETLIDLIAVDGGRDLADVSTFVARPGGAPANVAVALANLGVPSAFCGVVGDDPFGRRLRDELDRRGVRTGALRSTSEADTTIAFAWKNERGDGQFRLLRLADRLLSPEDIEAAGIEDAAGIVLGSVALTLEPSRSSLIAAVERARRAGIPVCVDINIRPSLWESRSIALETSAKVMTGATLLKFSLDDAAFLFGSESPEAAFEPLMEFGVRHLVVTDGARGAWYLNRGSDSLEFVPSFDVEAIDPTGAGDAFTAALIFRLIERDWQTIELDDLLFASAAGGLTTTKHGGIDALPTGAEIEAFLGR
jgi:fructokinase